MSSLGTPGDELAIQAMASLHHLSLGIIYIILFIVYSFDFICNLIFFISFLDVLKVKPMIIMESDVGSDALSKPRSVDVL